ncbi:MAG: carboxypeptidase-like regulatory domain-containing protein, partial [Flavobacteriaceae bacterium]|nr:carboxypeptidase-like regulatory domain-containing protein [Flavobacteriaceae bacterium]
MMKKLTLLAVLFTVGFLHAQVTTSNIKGVISDDSNQPLPGATIVAIHTPTGTTYGTITNDDGRVNMLNLRIGGPYKITVSYIGFKSRELNNVFLDLGQTFNLDISLAADTQELGEVVVTADRSN